MMTSNNLSLVIDILREKKKYKEGEIESKPTMHEPGSVPAYVARAYFAAITARN